MKTPIPTIILLWIFIIIFCTRNTIQLQELIFSDFIHINYRSRGNSIAGVWKPPSSWSNENRFTRSVRFESIKKYEWVDFHFWKSSTSSRLSPTGVKVYSVACPVLFWTYNGHRRFGVVFSMWISIQDPWKYTYLPMIYLYT